jgi:hypothetical protein
VNAGISDPRTKRKPQGLPGWEGKAAMTNFVQPYGTRVLTALLGSGFQKLGQTWRIRKAL